jgi:hypothetical protein
MRLAYSRIALLTTAITIGGLTIVEAGPSIRLPDVRVDVPGLLAHSPPAFLNNWLRHGVDDRLMRFSVQHDGSQQDHSLIEGQWRRRRYPSLVDFRVKHGHPV